MTEWKRVKIGDFLTERQERFKPDDERIQKYQRLDKIDFSGTIHLSNKATKTNMILVYPDDLVISGINVSKGALAVYKGNSPVTATIHYSSYTFDDSIIDLDFFKWFVKSPAFIEVLKNQVKGGIKTEIKASTFLKLEISIPETVAEQKNIVKNLVSQIEKVETTQNEIAEQKALIKKLRQSILQDAIEGKLTEDWRKGMPRGLGTANADACLDKNEKDFALAKSNPRGNKKTLPPITDEEKPFEIPESWRWVRLGEIANGFQYGSSSKSQNTGRCPVLRMGNIQDGKIDWEKLVYTNSDIEIEKYKLKKNDLLFNRTNSRELVGKTAIYDSDNLSIFAGYLIRFSMNNSNPFFANFVLNSDYHREWCNSVKTDALGQSNINAEKLKAFIFPLPPLDEQNEIVRRIENQLAKVEQLEQQVQERETLTKSLFRGILKNAFEGE